MLRPVARFLIAYFFALAVAVVIIHRETSLHPMPQGEAIASVWKEGQLIERVVLADERQRDPRLDHALAESGAMLVVEKVVADGPILQSPALAFGVSLVAGHDGLRATLGDKTVLRDARRHLVATALRSRHQDRFDQASRSGSTPTSY